MSRGADTLENTVGRTPWSAADAPVGLFAWRRNLIQWATAGPGGPARTSGSAPPWQCLHRFHTNLCPLRRADSTRARATRSSPQAGVTLIEVLVAMTLLSMLSVGILVAMQVGLSAFAKVDRRLMDNRRVSGAQRVVEQELEGMMPVVSPCGRTGIKIGFFQGEAQTMRLVSTFSLQQAWRGQPQILELFVIPGEEGKGVRLVVNEIAFPGPLGAGQLCLGMGMDPLTGSPVPRFGPVVPGPNSFVLADKLAYCHFAFLSPGPQPNLPPMWKETWGRMDWPKAVRIDMAPLDPDPSRLQPISVVAPIYIHRQPEIPYGDY